VTSPNIETHAMVVAGLKSVPMQAGVSVSSFSPPHESYVLSSIHCQQASPTLECLLWWLIISR